MGNVLSMDAGGSNTVGVKVDALRFLAANLENELVLMRGELQRVSGPVPNWTMCTNGGCRGAQLGMVDWSFLRKMNDALLRLHGARCRFAESLVMTSPTSLYDLANQRPCLPLQDEVMEPRYIQGENRTLQSDMEELKRGFERLEATTTQFLMEHAAEMEKLKEEHQSVIEALKQDSWKRLQQAERQLNHLKDEKVVSKVNLKEVLSTVEKLLKERESLLKENESLQEQIGKLEVKGGRQCGSYREGDPKPNDIQLLADKIKESLASFTKAVMYSETGVLKDVKDAVAIDCVKPWKLPGYKLKRTDAKFCYQKNVSETVFSGFEAEDFQIPGCNSEEMDVDKRRTDCYTQYNELVNWMSPGTYEPVVSESRTRGQLSFRAFRQGKTQQIMRESKVGKFWSGRDEEEGCKLAFRRSLDQMLRDVWLCHLLAFSFDPPCTIFKVNVGSVFDLEYMVDLHADNSCNSNAERRVALMIMPGFRIGKTVVRAQVYTTIPEGS